MTRWADVMMPTYAVPSLTLVRGAGATVWDDRGRPYVDLVAGIAVNALGHAHPAVVEAVTRQVATLGHTSNLVANQPSMRLATRLLELDGRDGRVFFANSGAEANETALKLSRGTARRTLVAAEGGFHGRTLGALSVTGQPAKRAPFEPLLPGVHFVPYGDPDALRRAVDTDTAAVLLEPVQGEAGVVVPPVGYLPAARAATAAAAALLVLDEVQTGIGRTGTWFAWQQEGAAPDVLTLAKGLGGGLPIGACLAFGAAAELLRPGQHGSTFGGNPVSCAAALAVLETIERDGLLERATGLGHRLRTGIADLHHPLVTQVRGAGLLIGFTLAVPVAAALQEHLQAAGFLVNGIGPADVRLTPPLVLSDAEADDFLAALGPALDAVAGTPVASVTATASDRRDR